MKFTADFHIHSKYSRATARNLDLENLYVAAQKKGLTVIGTGDFTHPAWWREIKEKLRPAADGDGLFELKPDIADAYDGQVPGACRRPVRFMLVTEISNIYKKHDRTRKNHNLVFMPDMDSAERFKTRLADIGNIESDGRPILGLDARNLLEIVLETDAQSFLIPAHVWTPWFSLLGSKSGFDSVEACFEDLTPHIFALETGLSSDPAMNWRVSGLDRYTLVSNSDAHSPSKLGREANRFNTQLSYGAIRSALETSDPRSFLGTYEFYPEEGKYHVDGHRKCGFRSNPQQTRALDNRCPECGKPLTLGVLYRVEALADRPEGRRSPRAATFQRLIPLEDVLSEVLCVGPKSKKVLQAGDRLIRALGPELEILCRVPREDLDRCGITLLAEAIERMRDGRVTFDPGYDGEFGQVRLFDPEERRALQGQPTLFNVPCHIDDAGCAEPVAREAPRVRSQPHEPPDVHQARKNTTVQLNPRQQAVVDHRRGDLCIVAGPGTGKTRTITCRIDALIRQGIDTILAVTFTNKAAEEMRQRLKAMQESRAPEHGGLVIATFHGFCWQLLQEIYDHRYGSIVDDQSRAALLADALALATADGRTIALSEADLLQLIVEAKQRLLGHDDDLSPLVSDPGLQNQFSAVYGRYQALLKLQELFDYEDLILETVKILESDATWRKKVQKRFSHIFVDEFQDINFGQYRLLRALTAKAGQVCVIGDPDQAIYGFRGSDIRYFQRFHRDYPDVRHHQLSQNYRSSMTILRASHQLMQGHQVPLQTGERAPLRSDISGAPTITVMATASPKAEAVAIGRTIEQMVGGIGFHSIDFEKLDDQTAVGESSFDDFAVLCRTGEQAQFIAQTVTEAGIPCQLASRNVVHEKFTAKLLAALKVVKGLGTYADFSRLKDLGGSAISRQTLDIFKLWAYAKQLPLTTALHAVNRFPVPGLGSKRQQRLSALAGLLERLRGQTAEMSLARALATIAGQTRLSRNVESRALEALMALAEPFHDQAHAFTTALALRKDTDYYHARAEKVAVMTLHAAKGLEFPTVFVAGCEDGWIPYQRTDRQAVDLDEERRLFYVGMTRAQERLILSWARKRTRFGKSARTEMSPFLAAIEPQLLEYQTPQSMSGTSRQKQLSLFRF
jgi:uncharacterized protein (TIGR00375 family)